MVEKDKKENLFWAGLYCYKCLLNYNSVMIIIEQIVKNWKQYHKSGIDSIILQWDSYKNCHASVHVETFQTYIVPQDLPLRLDYLLQTLSPYLIWPVAFPIYL